MSYDTYFLIKTKYCKYYAKIVKQYPNVHKVYFGGKRLCVSISVYLDMDEDNHPNIDTLSYNEKCNIEENLAQGKGSLHLLKSAMYFVMKTYPQHNKCCFELIDKSYITCTSPNNRFINIPLSYYYIMKHGGTWYEKKLGATKKYEYDAYKQNVRHMLQHMKQAETKVTFDIFADKYKVPLFMRESLRGIYDSHLTLMSFIHDLLHNYDCYVLKDWFKNMIQSFVHVYGDSWHIPYNASLFSSLQEYVVIEIEKPNGIMFGGDVENGNFGFGGNF